MAVAGLGDRPETLSISTRVFARDQPEITGELAGPFEAAPIHQLRGEHHRRVQRDAAEALEGLDHRLERRELGQLLDLTVELFTALQLVHQERMILAIDQPIFQGER